MQISSNLNNPIINSTRDYLPPSLSDAKVEKGDAAKAIDGYADSVTVSVGGHKIEAPLLSSRISGECKPVKLPEQQAPKLERPVLFLHGYMGKPEEFKEMSEWMSREGQNVNGGIINVDNLDNLDPKANMFTLAFTKPYQTMDTNAAEIKKTVEAICKATGYETIDIVAHSKGGLDARLLFSSSNRHSARDFASSVFPTPVGPMKRNDPIGFPGSFMPALLLIIASVTLVTPSSWPITLLWSSSSR